jgi:hypothetical protein
MKTILKVIQYHNNKKSKIISMVGSILGLTIMLLSIELYLDVQSITKKNDSSISEDFIVISKKVSDLSILNTGNNIFSENDLKSLANNAFVKNIASFKSCNYEVYVEIGNQQTGLPGFYTLAFFESIPTPFIDVQTEDWNWKSTNETVPVILPQNYLDAYNYGIAVSVNAPQISESILKKIRFKLHIKGNGKRKTYLGKIVGLSSKINSIMVPDSFLDYTNSIYGTKNQSQINRVIISTANAQDPSIAKYLSENNLTTNKNILKENIIQKLAKGILSYQLIICLIIIIQGILLILFYTKMVLYEAKYEIKQLMIIGYSNKIIAKAIQKTLQKTYVIIFGTCLILTVIGEFLISQQLNNYFQIATNQMINPFTILTYLLFLIIFILLNRQNLNKKLSDFSIK